MKILVHVNTLDRVSSFIYQNHIAFAAYFAKHHSEDQMFWYSPHRQAIDTARNFAAMEALKLECDYLMFIDDDVLVPPDAFDLLSEAKKDICSGLVYLRGYPFDVMAFKKAENLKVKDNNGNEVIDNKFRLKYYNEMHALAREGVELVECDAVGFSCCLIKVDVFQALEPPYFCTGPLNTEDVYFCLKTKNLDPNPTIFVNTKVKCGHLLNPEPIEFDTRLLLTNFYDNLAYKFNDEFHIEDNGNGRNLDYIERNLKKL